MLSFLDEFEGHPGYYTRLVTPVTTEDGTITELRPWLYVLEKYKSEMLQSEMFASYDSNGSHKLPYVERYILHKILQLFLIIVPTLRQHRGTSLHDLRNDTIARDNMYWVI